MGREIINSITCGRCKREFDVATEDIEWEHQEDAGETDENPAIHDFIVSQTLECSHCGYANKILMHGKGKDAAHFTSLEVISMERGSYI